MSDPRIYGLFQADLIIEATLRLECVLLEPCSLSESPVSTPWKVLGCWEFKGTKCHSKVNLLENRGGLESIYISSVRAISTANLNTPLAPKNRL